MSTEASEVLKSFNASASDEVAKYSAAQARDAAGRWIAGAGTAVKNALGSLVSHASNLASKVVRLAAGGLSAVHPVSNGGVHFTFEHATPSGGKLTSHAQIHPSHAANSPKATAALKVAHAALTAFGRPVKEPITAKVGGVPVSGSYASAAEMAKSFDDGRDVGGIVLVDDGKPTHSEEVAKSRRIGISGRVYG